MVQVRVVYGSIFSGLAGKGSEDLQLEQPTIDGLMQVLVRRHSRSFVEALVEPAGGSLLPGIAILVNGTVSAPDTVLSAGDEVALLVSFAGG